MHILMGTAYSLYRVGLECPETIQSHYQYKKAIDQTLNFVRTFISVSVLVKCDIVSLFHPGDFIMNVKQINSQSDLISMSSFAGPSYLKTRSSVYMILKSVSKVASLRL